MRLIDILDSVKRGKKTKFIAGFITVLIIAMIIFSGPASAITVNLTLESDEEDSLATGIYDYKAVVDVHTNDVVPLDLVYIKLTNVNSTTTSDCYYNLNTKTFNSTYSTGGAICNGISITNIINNAAYTTSYGYNYGYGYGDGSAYSEGLNNVSWNYGYGYGYANGYGYNSFTETLSTTGEVTVYFTVNSSSSQFSIGNTYSLKAGIAGLDTGAVKYIYYNKNTVTFVGKGSDTTPPIVTITNLVNNTLLGAVNMPYNITGNVSDDLIGVNFTSFYQNEILNQSSVDYSNPGIGWSQLWNPSDGVYNLTVQSCDYLNNCANASVYNIIVDKTAPAVHLINPLNDSLTNITTTAHSFNVTDAADYVNCTMYWNNFSDPENSHTWTGVSADGSERGAGALTNNNGAIPWTINCTDPAGNTGAGEIWVYHVDLTAPVITIDSYETDPTNQSINVTASTNEGTLNADSHLFEANGEFTFIATDSAGNSNSTTVTIINIDKTAPAFGNVSNITLYTNTSVAHNFAITDASLIVSNLSNNGNFSMNASGYFTNITVLVAGETYLVTLTAVDAASNVGQATIYVTALGTDAVLATNETTTLTNGTTEVLFNEQSSDVSEIVIPDAIPEDTEITLDLGALLNGTTVTIENNLTLEREGDENNYTAIISAGTVITGNSSWDGKITLPTVKASSGYSTSDGTVNVVIELGSSQELNFSKPVKIVMGGMAGKDAGWSRGTTLTAITTDCNSGNTTNVTQPSNINTNSPRECSLDDGEDLTIWTYHFTVFAAYTPVASSTDSTTTSSGGTSGGEFVSETDMVDGVSRQLYVGSVLAFNLFGERHSFIITSIKDNLVTVRVSSISQYATLAVGEEKKFDLNADDFYDLLVSVDDITSSRAAIIGLKIINESVSAAPVVTPDEEEITPTETTPGVGEKINDAMKSPITLIVAAIIIALAITLSVLYRRNNNRNTVVVSQHHHKHK